MMMMMMSFRRDGVGLMTAMAMSVLLLIAAMMLAIPVSSSLVNVKVTRKVVLSGNEAVHKLGITVRNDGDRSIEGYQIALTNDEVDRLADCMLIVDTDPKFISFCGPSKKAGDSHLVEVAFPSQLAVKESIKFRLQLVFIHSFTPFPKAIVQGALPFVIADDSALYPSPYLTLSQKTTFRLGTGDVKSFTKLKSLSFQKGSNIEYGPFNDVVAFSREPISIHFLHDKSLATVTHLVKEIEVSHWGNIAVEESYVITNSGPKLKGEYSRVDYDSPTKSNAGTFQWITAHLHPLAQDVYYRDSIGNVSTSHVRQMHKQVHLEVATRFPMMGGWTTDFYFGYNLPSKFALYNRPHSKTKFVLNIPFGTNFDDLVVDEMIVRVILPEGASNIAWETPFGDVTEMARDLRFTYLDTAGRPMLELRKKNVVSGYHGKDFQVTYDFGELMILREPILMFTGFMAFFILSIVYGRVDLSLTARRSKTSSPRHKPSSTTTANDLLEKFVSECSKNVDDAVLNTTMQLFLAAVGKDEGKAIKEVEVAMHHAWTHRREHHSEKFKAQIAMLREKAI